MCQNIVFTHMFSLNESKIRQVLNLKEVISYNYIGTIGTKKMDSYICVCVCVIKNVGDGSWNWEKERFE